MINGKPVSMLGFRLWPKEKKARLALDYGKGALELCFAKGDGPAVEEQPEELAFHREQARGGGEIWRAFYKSRLHPNGPGTYRPAFLCKVKLVPYDKAEKAQMDIRATVRKKQRERLRDETQKREAAKKNAEHESAFRRAMIRLAGAEPKQSPNPKGRPMDNDPATDAAIARRWSDVRSVKGILRATFLEENPRIFEGMSMARRLVLFGQLMDRVRKSREKERTKKQRQPPK